MEKPQCKIVVCTRGKKCPKRGSEDVFKALETECKKQDAGEGIKLKESGCLKMCKHGPIAISLPTKSQYADLTPEDAPAIVSAAIKGQTVDSLLLENKKNEKKERKKAKKEKKKKK